MFCPPTVSACSRIESVGSTPTTDSANGINLRGSRPKTPPSQRNPQNQTQPTQHPLISCHPNFFQLTLNQHKSNMNYLTSSALAEKSALETNNPIHTDMRSYVPEARPSPNQSNSQPLTKNKNLLKWIEKMAAIAQPAAIYWTVRRQITKPY